MDKFYKRVYQKLIEIDRKRSWLLEQTGTSPSTWSSWEKHGRFPAADRAVEIADALGVSVEFLVTGRETQFDLRGANPLVVEINTRLQRMSDAQLERVLTVVNSITVGDA